MSEHVKPEDLVAAVAERIIASYNGQLDAMVREAKAEALAEAKALLKERMIQAILLRAGAELDCETRGHVKVRSEASSDAEPADVAPAQMDHPAPAPAARPVRATQPDAAIRQEVEAIRRKLAENEQRLKEVRTTGPGAAKAQPSSSEPAPSVPTPNTPAGEGDDGCAYYVYGIIANDDGHAAGELPEEGIDPAYPVSVMPYRDIQAVVSRVALAQFDQEALKENLRDLAWLAARVNAHQRTLERLMAGRSLIPMRLCTIYRSEGNLREMLAQHYDEFLQALGKLEGRQEWGIKVYSDDERMAERVKEASPKAREAQAVIDKKSGGAAYFAKKQLETTLEEETERLRDEAAQCCHDRLSGHCVETTVLSLQSRETTGRNAEMILNGAYLVADSELAGFTAEANGLQEEYVDLGFSVELTGPWPAYNFVSSGDGGDVHAS